MLRIIKLWLLTKFSYVKSLRNRIRQYKNNNKVYKFAFLKTANDFEDYKGQARVLISAILLKSGGQIKIEKEVLVALTEMNYRIIHENGPDGSIYIFLEEEFEE